MLLLLWISIVNVGAQQYMVDSSFFLGCPLDQYYYYAGAIFLISVVSVTVSLVETKRNYRNLRDMVRFEGTVGRVVASDHGAVSTRVHAYGYTCARAYHRAPAFGAFWGCVPGHCSHAVRQGEWLWTFTRAPPSR